MPANSTTSLGKAANGDSVAVTITASGLKSLESLAKKHHDKKAKSDFINGDVAQGLQDVQADKGGAVLGKAKSLARHHDLTVADVTNLLPGIPAKAGVAAKDWHTSEAVSPTDVGNNGNGIVQDGITTWGNNSLIAAAYKDHDGAAAQAFLSGDTAQGLQLAQKNGDKNVLAQEQYLQSNGNLNQNSIDANGDGGSTSGFYPA